jgi:hypothetical protein
VSAPARAKAFAIPFPIPLLPPNLVTLAYVGQGTSYNDTAAFRDTFHSLTGVNRIVNVSSMSLRKPSIRIRSRTYVPSCQHYCLVNHESGSLFRGCSQIRLGYLNRNRGYPAPHQTAETLHRQNPAGAPRRLLRYLKLNFI